MNEFQWLLDFVGPPTREEWEDEQAIMHMAEELELAEE